LNSVRRSLYQTQISGILSGGQQYNSICINPFKSFSRNGTAINEDVYFKNKAGNSDSSMVAIYLTECKNSSNNNNCLPVDEQRQRILSSFVTFTYLESNIYLNNYNTPANYFSNSHTVSVSPSIAKKSDTVTIKQTNIQTDSGLIMENIESQNTYQIDSKVLDIDIQSSKYYYTFTLTGHNLIDSYSRRYIKVQDIIASLGGLLQFLITFTALFMKIYTYRTLEFEVINKFYNIREEGSRGSLSPGKKMLHC
jgi:hypothetical protein